LGIEHGIVESPLLLLCCIRSVNLLAVMDSDGDGSYSANTSRVDQGYALSLSDNPEAPYSALEASSSQSAPANTSEHLPLGLVGEEQYGLRDDDSAYDSASFLGSDTKSLISEVTRYRVEHGRQYHGYKDGSYWVCG
jgi:hypothetical protein